MTFNASRVEADRRAAAKAEAVCDCNITRHGACRDQPRKRPYCGPSGATQSLTVINWEIAKTGLIVELRLNNLPLGRHMARYT